MVMSSLAFVVSVIDRRKLADLKIFEVAVGALNRNFLLAALTLAAFISLVSLWLAFWNEGLSYLRNAKERLDDNKSPLPSIEAIQTSLDHINLAAIQIESLLKSDELRSSIAAGPVQLNEKYINSLMTIHPQDLVDSAFNRILNRETFLLSGPPTSSDSIKWIKFELEEAIGANIGGYLGGVSNQLITSTNPSWDGPSISRLGYEAKDNLNAASSNVKRLSRQIERYRRSLRFSRFTHQAETGWIGVGVPTVMFVVAGLHSLGAAVWSCWPSLPSLFQ